MPFPTLAFTASGKTRWKFYVQAFDWVLWQFHEIECFSLSNCFIARKDPGLCRNCQKHEGTESRIVSRLVSNPHADVGWGNTLSHY